MERTANLSFLEAAIEEVLSPKPCTYNLQDFYRNVSQQPNLKCQTFEVSGSPSNKNFRAFYISEKAQIYESIKPCIIYLHGLSSYVFEGSYLLPYIGKQYNLCMYDLRGHGKNACDKVTYGIHQSEDLYHAIVELIRKFQMKEFYLWGRSMGAGTVLQFLNVYSRRNPELISQKIKAVVLDSPFSSFQKISQQILNSNAYIPNFIASIVIENAFQKIKNSHKINFKDLNFTDLSHVKCPATFVYSDDDEIVAKHHSEIVMKKYGGKISKVHEKFTHNEVRSNKIMKQIFRSLAVAVTGGVTVKSALPLNKMIPPNMYSTPKKSQGLSVSISFSNSANKNKNTNKNKNMNEDYKIPIKPESTRIIPSFSNMNQSQNHTVINSFSMKSSVIKRKNTKIKTAKQIMEEEIEINTPKKIVYIPKPKPSVPNVCFRNQENEAPKINKPVSSNNLAKTKRERQYLKYGSAFQVEDFPDLQVKLPLTNRRYM